MPLQTPATNTYTIFSSSKLLSFHDAIMELALFLGGGEVEGVCTREIGGDVGGKKISVLFPVAETWKL